MLQANEYYDNNYSYYLQVFHIHCLGPVFVFASHMQVSPQFSDLIIFSLTSLFITDSCKVEFKDPNVLHEFTLTITPGKKVNLFPLFSVQTYCTVFINFYFLNWKEKATGRMGFLSFMSLYQRIIT